MDLKYIAYYRVSTDQQGKSGLGLEAQKAAVASYNPLKEYTEIETGKRNDRPMLAQALAACRLYGATLVIAKLDRLSRNAHFLLGLKEAGVDFIAADMPHANRLTVGIMAMVAEEEGRMISKRTKDALAAAKARGTVLGGFRGIKPTQEMRELAVESRRQRAAARAKLVRPTIERLQASGVDSLEIIAERLTALGIPTAQGKGQWSAIQVRRVLEQPC